MTREEAKELLPIIQAFVDGKTIEARTNSISKWIETTTPKFDLLHEYRIKPEPKYRPFKNAEECWQEMLKHQPFGWLKLKCEDTAYGMLTLIKAKGVAVGINDTPFSYHHLFYNYTFADRQPFGVKED